MPRGRPRKHNPTIPKHIDQERLPKGLYWDKSGSGRWYVLEPDPDGGRPRARTVATASARLSDLHAIIEQRNGSNARGTIGYLMQEFVESLEYRELSKDTQEDYSYCADVARNFKTKMGCTLDALQVDLLTTATLQRVIETIAKGKPESKPNAKDAVPPLPSKANHLLRYLRRLFKWGIRMGHCKTNPAKDCKEVKERKRFRMPEQRIYADMLRFARERGALTAHTKGSRPPYLWMIMELAVLCRLRGIEVVRLTDAHATQRGIRIVRAKGSRGNIVKWSPRLRAVWNAAITLRSQTFAKASRPIPIRAEQRFLFVDKNGEPLRKNTLKKSWQSLMHAAIEAGVITLEQRFTLHGLKHRGITDTKGHRKIKQDASGHKSEAALDRYDHDVPLVEPATTPDFSGEFSGVANK